MTKDRRDPGGLIALAIGTVAWAGWLAWRLAHPVPHPLWLAAVIAEVVGVLTGVTLALAMARRAPDRSPGDRDEVAHDAFARAVTSGARVGEVSAGELLRAATRAGQPLEARAVALGLLEGVRRLVLVTALWLGLLLGVATHGRPPWQAVAAAVTGIAATSLALFLLSGRQVRPGDRLVWSFAALGPTLRGAGRIDPRRLPVSAAWAGVMGVIVATNLTVALRGVSDRWTHGLPSMDHDDRVGAMAMGMVVMVTALAVLRRLPAIEPSPAELVPRRLEERSARQTALVTTVAVAVVGLVAGVLPGAVDAGDRAPGERLELRAEHQRGGLAPQIDLEPRATEVGDAMVVLTQSPPEHSDEP